MIYYKKSDFDIHIRLNRRKNGFLPISFSSGSTKTSNYKVTPKPTLRYNSLQKPDFWSDIFLQRQQLTHIGLVQFLNSPLSTHPHIGAEPGRAKRRVQDNLHVHAQNKPNKNYQALTFSTDKACQTSCAYAFLSAGSHIGIATLVPEAFLYSLLANFATRTASFNCFYWHEALRAEKRKLSFLSGSAPRSALLVANFQIKRIV